MDQNKTGIGSLLGTIIIIAIIILGGLYFWGKRVEESKVRDELVSSQMSGNNAETSESDDVDAIENDLNNTNLDLSTEATAE